MKINTVLFDLDGTLINTNELIISSLHTLHTYYPNQYKREDVLPLSVHLYMILSVRLMKVRLKS